MNRTRSERIHRGFHRVGFVLAIVILLIGLAYAFVEPFSFRANAVGFSLGFLVAATFVYALSRALGWIISGFAGE